MVTRKKIPKINAEIYTDLKHGTKAARAFIENSDALRRFVYNVYEANSLSPESSDTAISKSTIRIYRSGFFSCQGILLTQNGYFATAKHCLTANGVNRFNLTIKTSEGEEVKFDKICAISTIDDVAIGKIKMPGPPEPVIYKINSDKDWKGNLIAFRESHFGDNRILQKGRVLPLNNKDVETDTETYSGHLAIEMSSQAGYSGSPIVNCDAMLMGLTSTYQAKCNTTTFSKAYRILDLVSVYSQYLREV